MQEPKGILLLNKPKGKTSFHLVAILRKLTGVKKIGHCGTLDPFATGVMVMLIGKSFTRLSDQFLGQEKEYLARLHLGIETDTYDTEGQTLATSSKIPSLEEIQTVLSEFQGTISQIPPMFSAKKVQGKKLYELARKGIEIKREPVQVQLEIHFISYAYPYLDVRVVCSKGTYIRSLAHDIGEKLGTYAHLTELTRTRSGQFEIKNCVEVTSLHLPEFNLQQELISYVSNVS
jgi:tRNA pseudouridine55 synthase